MNPYFQFSNSRLEKSAFQILSLVVFLAFTQAVLSQDSTDAQPDLVIAATWDIGPVFKPVQEIDTTFEQEEFAAEIKSIREEFGDPAFMQLGKLLTPGMILETGFNSFPTNFIRDNKFDVLNYSTSDYVTGHSHGFGTKKRPGSLDKITLTGIDFNHHTQPRFPESTTFEKNGIPVRVASLTSKELVTAIPSTYKQALTAEANSVNEFFSEDEESFNVLLMEFREGTLASELKIVQGADLVFDLRPDASPAILETDIPIFEVPQSNGILILKGFKDEAGNWTWEKETRIWIPEDRMKQLLEFKLPMIGVSVPTAERIADLLKINPLDVTVEVFRDNEHQDLTNRENVYVYRAKMDGEVYRVYRLRDEFQIFWIFLDVLVVVNPDGTMRNIVTPSDTFPYHSQATRLSEAFQKLNGKPLSEWPDKLEFIAESEVSGIESQANLIFEDMRRTLQMDQRLFPQD